MIKKLKNNNKVVCYVRGIPLISYICNGALETDETVLQKKKKKKNDSRRISTRKLHAL